MDIYGDCLDCGDACRHGNWSVTYIYGDSGDLGRHFNAAWAVFDKSENNGKGKSGDQCR